jgi:hypothetical protein
MLPSSNAIVRAYPTLRANNAKPVRQQRDSPPPGWAIDLRHSSPAKVIAPSALLGNPHHQRKIISVICDSDLVAYEHPTAYLLILCSINSVLWSLIFKQEIWYYY